MVNTGFRYMCAYKWDNLRSGRAKTSVLRPNQRLVRLPSIVARDIPALPEWAHDGYIFSFLNGGASETWTDHPHWNDELDILTARKPGKLVYLMFDIQPTDEAYVADRAHYVDFQWGYNPDKQQAIRDYVFSRVPLNQYGGGFRMPELLIKNPISLDRFVVHDIFHRKVVDDGKEWGIVYESIHPSQFEEFLYPPIPTIRV